MINNKTVLAIIPARGGSKRLPDKNIKLLYGRPLIDYVIKAALKSQKIDELIVSTDSEKIKEIASSCGANVPFLRPIKLSGDDSLTEETVRHAVKYIDRTNGIKIDIIVVLQATNPFTTPEMIDKCINFLIDKDWNTVITVKKLSMDTKWIGTISKDKEFVRIINKDYSNSLSQKQYLPSGNVYVFKREICFDQKRIIGEKTGAIVVPTENAVDIDYLIDFRFAEFLLEKIYEC